MFRYCSHRHCAFDAVERALGSCKPERPYCFNFGDRLPDAFGGPLLLTLFGTASISWLTVAGALLIVFGAYMASRFELQMLRDRRLKKPSSSAGAIMAGHPIMPASGAFLSSRSYRHFWPTELGQCAGKTPVTIDGVLMF